MPFPLVGCSNELDGLLEFDGFVATGFEIFDHHFDFGGVGGPTLLLHLANHELLQVIGGGIALDEAVGEELLVLDLEDILLLDQLEQVDVPVELEFCLLVGDGATRLPEGVIVEAVEDVDDPVVLVHDLLHRPIDQPLEAEVLLLLPRPEARALHHVEVLHELQQVLQHLELVLLLLRDLLPHLQDVPSQ